MFLWFLQYTCKLKLKYLYYAFYSKIVRSFLTLWPISFNCSLSFLNTDYSFVPKYCTPWLLEYDYKHNQDRSRYQALTFSMAQEKFYVPFEFDSVTGVKRDSGL